MNPDIESRWFADGRVYLVEFDGAEVEVSVTDESGKTRYSLGSVLNHVLLH